MDRAIVMMALVTMMMLTIAHTSLALTLVSHVSTLIAPGEEAVPITVTLVNNAQYPIFNVTIRPVFTFPFGPYNYVNGSYIVKIPAMTPGSMLNITMLIDVNPQATDGIYVLPFNVTYVFIREFAVNKTIYIISINKSELLNATIPLLGYVKFSAEAAIWGSPNNPIEAVPGEGIMPLVVPIVNIGNVMAYNVSASLKLSEGLATVVNETTVGYAPPGSPIYLVFLVNVTNAAKVGVLYGKLTIHYFNNSTQTMIVKIPIVGKVSLTVPMATWGTPSSPMVVGPDYGVVPLTLTILNTGSAPATGLTVNISLPGGLVPLINSVSLGAAPVGEPIYAVFMVNVTNVLPGTYYMNVTLTYNNGLVERVRVPVVIEGKPNLIVEEAVWGSPSSPITVGPGYGAVPLTLVLVNSGSAIATNVKVNITLPKGFVALVRNASIGDIPIGTPIYVPFMVNITNVSPGTYYMNVTIIYDNDLSTTGTVPIVVSGSPNVILQSYYTNPPNLFPGYPAALLTIYIDNSGTAIARNVEVKLVGDGYVNVVSPPNGVVNIGNLPIGTPIPVEFIISTSSDVYSEVQANLTLEISGLGFNKSFTVPLAIKPKARLIIANVTGYFSVGDSNVPLYITIKNVGNVTAKNVEVVLNGQGVIEPHVSSSNPLSALTAGMLFVGDLKPGEEKQIVFMVDVQNGINPGTYHASITLIWNQTGSLIPLTQNDAFSLNIHPSLSQELVSLLTPNKPVSILFYIVLILIIILVAVAIRARA